MIFASITLPRGIAIALLSGAGALISEDRARAPWLALPFGTGAGLTLDQVAQLLEGDDVYWDRELVVLLEALAAVLGTVALAARALVRGERSNENAGVAATGPQGSGRQATST